MDWLKEARKNAGLTVQELAKQLQVDVATVYRWESGKSKPQLDCYFKLEEMFHKQIKTLKNKQRKGA